MGNKILKNLKLGLAGIVLAGSLNGCYIFKNIEHEFALKKYSPLTTEQKDSLFKELNSELKNSSEEVYIIKEKDFKKRTHVAHTHHNKHRTICFLIDYKDDSEVHFHEFAHAKHIALNQAKKDFSEKWKETADFEYGRKNFILDSLDNICWKNGTVGSKNGMLNAHSSKSIYEDVADFVECLSYNTNPKDIEKIDTLSIKKLEEKILKEKYDIDLHSKEKDHLLLQKSLSSSDSLLLDIRSLMIKLSSNIIEYASSLIEYEKIKPLEWAEKNKHYYPLFFADTTDHRYQKKLDLLKEYNFFTNEEHEKLSENLGSLNYLLKDDGK